MILNTGAAIMVVPVLLVLPSKCLLCWLKLHYV